MLEARNLWELVEQRAEASPDSRMSVDEHGRSMTFGAVPRRGRARGRRPGRARRGRGRCRVLGAPDLARVAGPGRRAVPARRGAEPDHPHLPRPRGRLLHRARPARRCCSCRARGATSTSRRWAIASPGRRPRPAGRRVRPRAARRRSGQALPPRPAAARQPGRRSGQLALLHVGHHRRPEGRAAHRRRSHRHRPRDGRPARRAHR